MREIVDSIQHVNDIVSEISVASTGQSDGGSQVGQAIGQMDETTQRNAAPVEESAAAAGPRLPLQPTVLPWQRHAL
jgi:methyl-accepting chemotaxis protein